MIAASLPLILVAVVCLAIGLIQGSSSLLIASIVASLLAAVALVIGVRQRPPGRPEDSFDEPDSFESAPRRASDAHDSAPAGAAFAADSGFAGSHASDSFERDSSAAAGPADPIGFPAADEEYGGRPATDQGTTGDLPRTGEGARDAGTHLTDESVVSPHADADYQAASSTIGAARDSGADDQAWRRPAAAADQSFGPGPAPAADPAYAADPASSSADPAFSSTGSASSSSGSASYAAGPGDDQSRSGADFSGTSAWARGAGVPGQGTAADGPDAPLGDEFDEPDADDPDDEPLPQSVRPTDAVQVARLDTEVLVVDGRPRYHMADCPHLVGRLTESLPAAEAVELGFSPCGLCRPVDRLLGANARR